ncbi:phosphatidate cytidylyltransferase [Jeongeupia naejangsanensis]|uniref:Phosphatidate cytidylyltransferase n=1 Tax=Jeongeupia naejangsanensis TaxID=613195 RepID=A0ABS2BFS9_9NEIS|nr:phosphatidate cytidylyltransferase [Jeongeupia naejangsanensis]MBM3114462.1 phosphatidate cytidylyltransferase [Jeongeupia naejangsanensis]
MLKQRVLTALVLIPLILLGLFALPQQAWIGMVAVIIGFAAWEWQRLAGMRGALARAYPFATPALFLALTLSGEHALGSPYAILGVMLAGCVFWGAIVPFWLRAKWRLADGGNLNALLGWAVLLPAGLSMIVLREGSMGGWLLLMVMAIAWVADTAAYFSGKAFGRHKLAPSISPGKSWEGAIGGMVGVVVYALLVPKTPLVGGESISSYVWVLLALVLTVLSIAGDLLESLFKRQVGLKDSSQLLPGHGGVLDRIDSLLAILPVAAAIYLSYLLFHLVPGQ